MTTASFSTMLTAAMVENPTHEVSEYSQLEQILRFLIEIGYIKPNIIFIKWGIAANAMNDYLFQTGHYLSKYAFHDGQHCCSELGKKNRYMLPRKEVFRVTPLNGWAHGENIGFDYFKSLIPREYYDSVDEQLIKIYEES